MADELIISAILNSEGVVSGAEAASASIKELAAQVLGSSEQMGSAFEAIGNSPGITQLLTGLMAVGDESETSASQLQVVGSGAEQASSGLEVAATGAEGLSTGLGMTVTALEQAVPVELAFSEALEAALAPLTASASLLEGVVVPAEQAFSAALDALLEPLVAVGSELQALTPLELAFSEALDKVLSPVGAVTAALNEGASSELAFKSALDSLFEPLVAIEGQAQKTAESLELVAKTGEAVGATSVRGPTTGVGAETSEAEVVATNALSEAEDKLFISKQQVVSLSSTGGEAVAELQAEAAATDASAEAYLRKVQETAAVAEAQQEVITSDNALAASEAEVTAELDSEQASVLASGVALAAKTEATEATVAANLAAKEAAAAYHIALGEGVTPTGALAENIEKLNNVELAATLSTTELEVAIAKIAGQAEKAGFTLKQTAEGYVLLKAAAGGASVAVKESGDTAEGAAVGMSNLERQIAFASARMGAQAIGAGQLSYSFGILARAVPGLAAAFNILLAPILITTFVDIVSGLIDKFTKLGEEIRKAGVAWDELASSEIQGAEATELQNLKLEDQLAKLEGRPTSNRLKEAILEADQEIQKLDEDLEKANEKILELLETKGVTLWDSLITGAEYTGTVFSALQPKFVALAEARSQLVEANNQVTLSELKLSNAQKEGADESTIAALQQARDIAYVNQGAAEAQVAGKKKIAADELAIQTKSVEDKKALALKETHEIQGATGFEARAESTPITEEQAEVKFSTVDKALEDARKFLQGEDIKQEAIKQTADLKKDIATAENVNERSAIEYKAGEERIKAAEEFGQKLVAVEKQVAESDFKAAEDGAKLQVVAAESAGQKRAAAELTSVEQIKSAQAAKNQAELNAFDESTRNNLKRWQDQKTLDESFAPSGERSVKIQQDEDKINEIQQISILQRAIIVRNGQTELDRIEATAEAQRLANARENAQAIALQYREAERDVQKTGALELRGIEESTRAQERLFSLGRLTRNEEIDQLSQTIALLREKERAAVAAIEAEIAAEQKKQQPGGEFASGDAYKASVERVVNLTEEITNVTERWQAAIDQVTANYDKLDLSTSTWMLKLEVETTNEVETFLDQWQSALKTLNNGFASSFDEWLAHGKSFGQGMANIGIKMLEDLSNDIIKIGLQLVELTAVKGLRDLFGLNKPVLTPGPGAPGVATTGAPTTPSTNVPPPPVPGAVPVIPPASPTPALATSVATAIPPVSPAVPSRAAAPVTAGITGPTPGGNLSSPEIQEFYQNYTAFLNKQIEQLTQEGGHQTEIQDLVHQREVLAARVNASPAVTTAPTVPPSATAEASSTTVPVPGPASVAGLIPTPTTPVPVTVVSSPAGGIGATPSPAAPVASTVPTSAAAPTGGQVVGVGEQAASLATTGASAQDKAIVGFSTGIISLVQRLNTLGTAAAASAAAQQGHATVVAASTSAQTLNTGSTALNTTSTIANTGSTTLNTAGTVANTGGTALNTGSTIVNAGAQTVHTGTTVVATGVQTAHTTSVTGSLGAFIAHEAAVIADTIAIIIHKIVTLFTSGGAATGGLVQGPGSGTSDSIPIMVSHGEYVVKAAVVAQPGMLEMLHTINKGDTKLAKTGKHAEGGFVAGMAEGGHVSHQPFQAQTVKRHEGENYAEGGVVQAFSHGGETNVAYQKFAQGGVVGGNSAYTSSPSYLTFSQGGIIGFAEGGDVGKGTIGGGAVTLAPEFKNVATQPGVQGSSITHNANSESTSVSNSNNTVRFQQMNSFQKDFDADEHGEAIAGVLMKKLRMAGFNV